MNIELFKFYFFYLAICFSHVYVFCNYLYFFKEIYPFYLGHQIYYHEVSNIPYYSFNIYMFCNDVPFLITDISNFCLLSYLISLASYGCIFCHC